MYVVYLVKFKAYVHAWKKVLSHYYKKIMSLNETIHLGEMTPLLNQPN